MGNQQVKSDCCARILILIFVTLVAAGDGACVARDRAELRCGSYCLMTALLSIDRAPAELEHLESSLGDPSDAGYSMLQLLKAAEHQGAFAAAVHTNPENLSRRNGPFVCIALLNGDHFAILADVSANTATIVDPPDSHEIPLDTLMAEWDGRAVLIADRPLESEELIAARTSRDLFLKSLVRNTGLALALGLVVWTIVIVVRRRSTAMSEAIQCQ
jgi:ABC-type bacteriocin/lantibiotic exporter with double-glycine peptidase domain